jgi:hypothetical protein
MIMKTNAAAKKSTTHDSTAEMGNRILDTASFLIMLPSASMEDVPLINAAAKKDHGTKQEYTKMGYGMPSVSVLRSRPKTMVKTNMRARGCMTAHTTPMTDCAYLDWTSLITKALSNSHFCIKIKPLRE